MTTMTKPEVPPAPARTSGAKYAVHIPPEEAFALAMLAAELIADAWQRTRWSWSTSMRAYRNRMEFALEHERSLGALLRNAVWHRR